MKEKEYWHITVSGRVQGVGYRWFTREAAKKYGIIGTVQNLDNGDVEIFASGYSEILLQFTDELKKGPSFGFVKTMDIDKNLKHKKFTSFTIISSHSKW